MAATKQRESSAVSHDAVMRVVHDERWLVISFAERVRACSWAIVGGGLVDIDHVAWLEVRDDDLRPPVVAHVWLAKKMQARGLTRAVGLLTSRRVSAYRETQGTCANAIVRCVATVGMGNALRAGDPQGVAGRIGTINMLVYTHAVLSDAALLESSAIATEAKVAAVMDAGMRSVQSGRPATGTGTDCVVVSGLRATTGSRPVPYAGKHTAIGAAVGDAVLRAVAAGIAQWKEENG